MRKTKIDWAPPQAELHSELLKARAEFGAGRSSGPEFRRRCTTTAAESYLKRPLPKHPPPWADDAFAYYVGHLRDPLRTIPKGEAVRHRALITRGRERYEQWSNSFSQFFSVGLWYIDELMRDTPDAQTLALVDAVLVKMESGREAASRAVGDVPLPPFGGPAGKRNVLDWWAEAGAHYLGRVTRAGEGDRDE